MTGMEERMAALRARFVERTRAEREELGAALGRMDLPEIRRLAHGLSGSAGIFGFPEISAAAAGLERAVDEEPEAVGPAAKALLHLLGGLR
jgi:HPt (histidine-containing phosphotransfer) domain-containing protein